MLDIAEKTSVSGSFGTKVVTHPKLSTGWTPILSTNKAGTTFLTHTGLYTVWARVYSTSPDLPWLRLVYGVGDIVAPQENTQVQVPGGSAFYLVNLGQVNITALPFGAQRWEGVIQGRGELGGENVSIDRVWFQCDDECSGVLAALTSTTALASVVASDSLTGTGALSGSEAVRGGDWEEEVGSGTGFTRGAEGVERKTTEDAEGHTAILSGSTVGANHTRYEVGASAAKGNFVQGFYLRYYSSTYWVRVSINGYGYIRIEYKAGGSVTEEILLTVGRSAPLLLEAEINANAMASIWQNGSRVVSNFPVATTFKKGEAHAEGKIGVYDYNPTTTTVTRISRLLVASPLPPSDAVMYPDKAAYLSTNGMYRESEDGLGAGPIGHPGADLPRLPVSGPEEAPVEIAVKASRGQFGEVADSGKDAVKVQVAYRPCYASIPEA